MLCKKEDEAIALLYTAKAWTVQRGKSQAPPERGFNASPKSLTAFDVLPKHDAITWEWKLKCFYAADNNPVLADKFFNTGTMLFVEEILTLRQAQTFSKQE